LSAEAGEVDKPRGRTFTANPETVFARVNLLFSFLSSRNRQ
jgi:hypothetical protein